MSSMRPQMPDAGFAHVEQRDPEPQIGWFFAMPMVRRIVPDAGPLNESLKALVLARRQREPGTQASNVGGWQSPPDLLDSPAPCIAILRSHIVSLIRFVMAIPADGDASRIEGRLGLCAWANVNQDGDFNRIHDHAGNHWSGVYYVSLGETAPGTTYSGTIEFLDPRPSANMPIPGYRSGSAVAITPTAGEFILFPSWIQHYVMPFRGRGERISIAFNAQIRDYVVKE